MKRTRKKPIWSSGHLRVMPGLVVESLEHVFLSERDGAVARGWERSGNRIWTPVHYLVGISAPDPKRPHHMELDAFSEVSDELDVASICQGLSSSP